MCLVYIAYEILLRFEDVINFLKFYLEQFSYSEMFIYKKSEISFRPLYHKTYLASFIYLDYFSSNMFFVW